MCVCSFRHPACNAHAPYYHLWRALLYKICPFYIINCKIFERKKILLKLKPVFCFSLQLLSQIFLILRRIERDTIKMYIGLNVKYQLFLFDSNETWILSINFRNCLQYQISWKSVQWQPSCSMRTKTDYTKLIVVLRYSVTIPKMYKNILTVNKLTNTLLQLWTIFYLPLATNIC